MNKIITIGLFLLLPLALSSAEERPELVKVPAGKFVMGSKDFPRSRPVREVTISDDYYIGKYEVTNRQYADALNYALARGYLNKEELLETAKRRRASGVSRSPQPYQDVFDEDSGIAYENGVFQPIPGREDLPVVEVTWHGAAFYCNILSELEGLTPLYNLDDWSCRVYGATGYRLPTEAEWEYAASYPDGRKYPWGNRKWDRSRANAGHKDKTPPEAFPVAVGSYSPRGDSKLGICDLAGNVAEWCNDWYSDSYPGEDLIDPVGAGQELFFNLPVFKKFSAGRVLRGGCFLMDPEFRKGMGPPFITDTVIHPEQYDNRFRSYDFLSRNVEGFRVAKTVATEKTVTRYSAPEAE